MKLRQLPVLVATLVFACLASSSAQIQLRPGQYERTSDMVLNGVKQTPTKRSQCFTAEDVKTDLRKLFMEDVTACKVADYKATGNKITLHSNCEGITSTIEVTLAAESFTTVAEVKGNDGRMTATVRETAKRVGECKK